MRTSSMMGLMFLAACSHVRPESETVDEHRSDAASAKRSASEERTQFAPGESRLLPSSLAHMPMDSPPQEFIEYNPSAEHLTKADAYLRESADHLKAASTLIASEDKACAGLPAGERFSCPLLASSVERVQPDRDGSR